MRKAICTFTTLLAFLTAACSTAQPPGRDMSEILRTLPLEGAPLAEPGPYAVTWEAAFDEPGFIVFRPIDLGAFPAQDKMPVLVWGNGGCNIDGRNYAGILSTVASHGFIAIATLPVEPEEGEEARRNATADDMLNAITWAEQEAIRDGSHLRGKIDITQVSAMGVSCGGFRMAAVAGLDPRVDSVGILNSGVSDTSELDGLHGPLLLLNGGEVDFMYEAARENFEAVNHIPVFLGARENAGHSATYPHPGGGEFANVVSDWLMYQFKGDQQAGQTFVGENCVLCTNDTWETDSKGLE
jgi:predicted small secreted protein/dienelactone hydrolase